MRTIVRFAVILPAVFLLQLAAVVSFAQSTGTINGTITDQTGAVIQGATVNIDDPVSQYSRATITDSTGHFQYSNVPMNTYHLTVSKSGFSGMAQDVDVRSVVPVSVTLKLQVGGESSTVTVESGGDLIEDDPTFHVDLDRDLFNKVPLESASSSLSSLVTLSTPGVAADSNGLFHGLGDHASNSFSIDGQSITDQQSKIFSNQLPSNAVESLEVISGAPPAEYGGKTSLVIVATTRSGQGVTKPTGAVYGSYGSFGSATGGLDLSYGGKAWGNFLEADGLNTGRFLDPPEFSVFHAKGNEENIFDRVDYSFDTSNSVHLDMNYSRSWFQTPNTYDNLNVQNVISGGASANPTFGNVGNTDQRSQIGTYNISPTFTHVINDHSVWNLGAWVRRDNYDYYPSGNPLADQGAPNVQTSLISQNRTLTNAAVHTDLSYVKGVNNFKFGAQYGQTFLREHDSLGVVNATYNSPCVDVNGSPLPGYTSPSQCNATTSFSNDPSAGGTFNSLLEPYDLTRGGAYYLFLGHTDVKELALYIEDQLKVGNWNFNLGLRGDIYNGLARAQQAEPRLGISYNVKPTATVLAVSYARTLETPFNENLVLSSNGCSDALLNSLLACQGGTGTLQPGFRNEFHASIQQALGKNFMVGGEYIWKYTHNAFDFSILGNTPITFPIDWHNSKIPGYAIHADVPQIHGFSAYVVMSSVAARFFPPQVAGAGATVGQTGLPFRIDHDEKFNQTTHLNYTVPGTNWLSGIWGGFNWRYDSGLVAGNAPCYGVTDPNSPCGGTSDTLNGQPAIDMLDAFGVPLTADEEFEAGFECNGQHATQYVALPSVCPASQFSSSLINIPAPNTGDNDKNPQRIAPRNLFDATLGKNNIFHAEHYKTDLGLTAINVTNKYALYNFLSTFSGTHYVTPRALTVKVTVNF